MTAGSNDPIQNELEALRQQVIRQQAELDGLKSAIDSLQNVINQRPQSTSVPSNPFLHHSKKQEPAVSAPIAEVPAPTPPTIEEKQIAQDTVTISPKPVKPKGDVESFIGQRIAMIIGIIVLVLGLGYLVKYAIDADLITPAMRIILAFVAGGTLVGFAWKLKAKYEPFSATLLAGGMAVLYFTTFAGFELYQLYPKGLAFALMLVFTAFTVLSALVYNRQVIGILGLCGAYAVPIMLSDGTGKAAYLFTYMAIINCGILFLTFKKDWKILENLTFFLTWTIFGAWFAGQYASSAFGSTPVHSYLNVALLFASVFFLQFYAGLLVNALLRTERSHITDIIRLGTNSLLFLLIAGAAVAEKYNDRFNGLFTLLNAVIHFGLASIVFRRKKFDTRLLYSMLVIVITLLTVTIPVQLDGKWVTIFWAVEMVLLYLVGRWKNQPVFCTLGALMILPLIVSLGIDWSSYYDIDPYYPDGNKPFKLLLNAGFFTGIITAACLFGVFLIDRSAKFIGRAGELARIGGKHVSPLLAIIVLYFTGYLEISTWTDAKIGSTALDNEGIFEYDYALYSLRTLWLNIYSLLFISVVAFIQPKVSKSLLNGWLVSGVILLTLIFSATSALDAISSLRRAYFEPGELFVASPGYIYLPLLFFIVWFITVISLKRNMTLNNPDDKVSSAIVSYVSHFFTLVGLSALLIHLLVIMHPEETAHYQQVARRAGLTILWAAYALILVGVGMKFDKTHSRIAGMILLGVTLIKLLLFDTRNLPTIYKVIAFIAVGLIVLLVSFLYYRIRKNKDEDTAA